MISSSESLTLRFRSHVINQPLYPDQVRSGSTMPTLRNTTVTITFKGDDMYFNDAKVKSTAMYVAFGLSTKLQVLPLLTLRIVLTTASSTSWTRYLEENPAQSHRLRRPPPQRRPPQRVACPQVRLRVQGALQDCPFWNTSLFGLPWLVQFFCSDVLFRRIRMM